MQTLDPAASSLLAAIVVIVLLAIAAWFLHERRQSERLQTRFGDEYHRLVEHTGNRKKAEAELRHREQRVAKLNIVPLSRSDAQRFGDEWRGLQSRFVDDPKAAVNEADLLVRELMRKRGYPMGDFENRAADISVDHPRVVENYRSAHDIAMRAGDGKTDTETLRKAVVYYRALFDELLEVTPAEQGARVQEAMR